MILLTGPSGFVGKAVLVTARERGLRIRPAYRSKDLTKGYTDAAFVFGLDGSADWSQVLQDVDVVIHAAARPHKMREEALDSLSEYRRVNVMGTLNLARQSAAAGVRRFVFISSIKVNGEATEPGHPFTANDNPSPEDAYGLSKAEAEHELKQVARETGMDVTVIRPPLIYGPGVKGNLANLISAVRRGLPLPLGGLTHNRRSLVGLDNLVDLLIRCVDHPAAAGQTFLVSDGEDLSTPDLLHHMAASMGRSARLLPVPVPLLRLAGSALGKRAEIDRLVGSLQIDSSHTRQVLGWTPPVSVEEGIRRMVQGA